MWVCASMGSSAVNSLSSASVIPVWGCAGLEVWRTGFASVDGVLGGVACGMAALVNDRTQIKSAKLLMRLLELVLGNRCIYSASMQSYPVRLAASTQNLFQ